jgi:uncharacterized protein with PQ loop repeat
LNKTACGAYLYTFTAANAFIPVHHRPVVGYDNGVGGADFNAFGAGNAAYFTNLAGFYPLVGVFAGIFGIIAGINHCDKIFWAGRYAKCAAGAFLAVNYSHSVYNMNGIIIAGLYAVTVAVAAVGAFALPIT